MPDQAPTIVHGAAAGPVAAAPLSELAASGVELDGQLQVARHTWFVYGRTSYDGEVVVARYEDAGEAAEALRLAPPAPVGHLVLHPSAPLPTSGPTKGPS